MRDDSMAENLSQEDYLSIYRQHGAHLAQCTDDFGTASDEHNHAMKSLGKIWRQLKQDPSIDTSFFLQLLEDENLALRKLAAAHCLGLGIYVFKARRTLKNLMREKNPYISGTAGFTLEAWKRNGKKLTF